LFKKLWDTKEKSGIIPVYIKLKKLYSSNTKLSEIFESWEEYENICFIIDGVDEISHIKNFISELGLFILKNKNKNYKFVISCRTNIYEKYLIKIDGFDYFYLENLTDKQITAIFKNEFQIELQIQDLNKYRVFLENPFNLFLFGDFYLKNERFSTSISEAFELSIEQELKILNKEKFDDKIDVIHVYKILQKISVINELMHENSIVEKRLYSLLGKDDKDILEKISFIEKDIKTDTYFFRHKNYQEFLAAKYISELSSDKILDFIKIEGVNKTKPALFNTITFLLSILKDEKFKFLHIWLSDNENEILFLLESGTIGKDLQKGIFRKYFDDVVIKKTFWIGKGRRFDIEKIANFADVDYLIDIITDKSSHFRTTISAYTILSFADFGEKKEDIKNILQEKILSGNESIKNIYEILRVIKNRKLHRIYPDLFIDISHFFKGSFDKDINYEIISMLDDFDNIDDYFPILYNCLKKLYEINPKNLRDDTVRGTKWILEKIFLRIQNPENFIKILDILFNRKYYFKLSDFPNKNYYEKLIEKCEYFIIEDIDFLYRMINAFLRSDDPLLFRRDGFLSRVINGSGNNSTIFKYIIKNYGLNSKTFYLLSGLYSTEKIDYFSEKYNDKKIIVEDEKDITILRNLIFQQDKELGYYFESKMQNIGFLFDEGQILPSNEKLLEQEKEFKEFAQKNWDILFEREKLLVEIESVFNENKIEKMTWLQICDISHQYRINNGKNYNWQEKTVNRVISHLIRDNGDQTFESIKHILEDDYVLLSSIKNKLKSNQNKDFKISEEQISFIKEKCIELSGDFDYEKVLKFSNSENDHYSTYIGYYILKMLYFFDKEFSIIYRDDFYIETLKYSNVGDSANNNETFEFIKERINNLKVFSNQIVQNINERKLDYFSLKSHVEFALENKLEKSYEKIGAFFLADKHSSVGLEAYSKLISNDVIFLKKCCEDIDSYLCWTAIKILKKNNLEIDFIEKIANDYINSGEINHLSSALDIVFYLNKSDALKNYVSSLKNVAIKNDLGRPDGFVITYLENFSNLSDLNLLEELFKIIYNSENNDFNYHNTKSFFNRLIVQLSKSENGKNAILKILNKIKSGDLDDSQKFFINSFIEDSENSYLETLAKPLNFEQAKNLIENFENNRKKSIVMGDQYNFGDNSAFKGNQFGGKNNTQTNYFNKFSNDSGVLRAEEILKEFNQLQTENNEWKQIFMDGMQDLLELKHSEDEEQELKSKSKLRKIHDFIVDVGKKTKDWTNLAFLPLEFHDKVPKLLEMGNHLKNIFVK
jgi:hypothetical protein